MNKGRKLKPFVLKILVFLMLLCLCGMAYSIYRIITWKQNVDANDVIMEEMVEFITIEENPEDESETIKVDFASLKEQNSDTVGYLRVNGIGVDYVVVKGSDNDFYLNHNFKKEWNSAGWIFADYRNKFDGSDENIVIYGHNMLNGSMFGNLKMVLRKEWYENPENLALTFITEEGTSIYQVFSTYSIIPEDYYINTNFDNDEEYVQFLKTIKSRSVHDYNVNIDATSKIITLSSCTANGTKRVVLHAVRVM